MKFFKKTDKMIKNLDTMDIALTKLSVFFFTLWLIALIPSFSIWVISSKSWWFMLVWIILAIRPLCNSFMKK
uniref:Uncharacterized protein n=1 Tax=candidate division CPR3 bacterium TaxID=2268181 RepID=A0A7C4M0E9_UNCC3